MKAVIQGVGQTKKEAEAIKKRWKKEHPYLKKITIGKTKKTKYSYRRPKYDKDYFWSVTGYE